MKLRAYGALLSSLLLAQVARAATDCPKIDSLLSQMTLEEKVAMLSGDETGFNSPGVERLGVPMIYMTDGPVGVRLGQATAFPVSVNMAAGWDTALVRQYGNALAEETLAKGRNCILGPCVGVQRYPLGGRNFESFGEDPFLSAMMDVDFIRGVQEKGVIATIKHYATNDQEWERRSVDSIVSERALREVHLLPFEYGVKDGGVWMLMSSYNLVNGTHASENAHLLTDVLKNDWGFKGLVVSDWTSTYSTEGTANAGLDIEMPDGVWFGARLLEAVADGRVSESVIDDKIRRHLRVRFAMGLFDNPVPAPDQSVIESDAHRALARTMAEESITLLKNDGLLPLERGKHLTIALIGPNALYARSGGGGSALVNPWTTVSPLEGLRKLLGDDVTILAAEGVDLNPADTEPFPSAYLRSPDGQTGLRGEYFANMKFEGEPALVRVDKDISFEWNKGGPAQEVGVDNFSVRWTGTFTPPLTADYCLGTISDDGSRLYVDGKLVSNNWGTHGMFQTVGKI
ncbi:MAG: glycoside hydrolase family 3 N-terminal domain-containing protein, partial [Opitutales bacterium]